MKFNLEELKFEFNMAKNELKVVLSYFFKEPFYELKRLIAGYYNSTLFFWASVILYIYLWKKNIGNYRLKIAGLLIILSYFYMFYKSNRWREYYEKEFIKGKRIE